MASDPDYNLAAQLLAADVNVTAGAGSCPASVKTVNDSQSLLKAIGFSGTGTSKMTLQQTTKAHLLATHFDQYNHSVAFCAAPPSNIP